jgi:hypothetical protein
MQSVLRCLLEKKARQLGINLPPKQALPLGQPGVQSHYFITTKFWGEISIEKRTVFRP